MTGATHLGAPALDRLNAAAMIVSQAFGGHGVYLVGSCLERSDFRDVDVRCILDDAQFEKLFGKVESAGLEPFRCLLHLAVSDYLAKATGLPIDFQIQQRTDANIRYNGKRHPIGWFTKAHIDG